MEGGAGDLLVSLIIISGGLLAWEDRPGLLWTRDDAEESFRNKWCCRTYFTI